MNKLTQNLASNLAASTAKVIQRLRADMPPIEEASEGNAFDTSSTAVTPGDDIQRFGEAEDFSTQLNLSDTNLPNETYESFNDCSNDVNTF